MATRTIVFRTDASILIGSGHVMRCLTLAEALRASGWECHFICRAHVGNLLGIIRQRGFTAHELSASDTSSTAEEVAHSSWLGCDWSTDALQSLAVLVKLDPDWLIVDHYSLGRQWEMAVRQGHCRLMAIDDLADRPHDVDLLLDQNLGRQQQDYDHLTPATCTVLTGPQYALLRPEFVALREQSLKRRQVPTLQHLLISMGGVDKDNATGDVLAALKQSKLPSDCRISIVMGAQAPWIQEIRDVAAQMPYQTEILVNIDDMAQRMMESDLSIGAAGSTAWERCCLGLPALIVVLANNQWPGARALAATQAALLLGDQSDITGQLPHIMHTLMHGNTLATLSRYASRVADGHGTARVTAMLEGEYA